MDSKIRRFFEPYRKQPGNLFLYVLRYAVFLTFWGIALSFLLSEFSKLLIARDVPAFERLVFAFAWAIAAYYVFVWAIRHTGLPNLKTESWKYLHRKYLPIVLGLDNNYAETLGSARTFSIIDKWWRAWTDALASFFEQATKLVVVGVPTFVMLFGQPVSIIAVALSGFALVSANVAYFNSKLRKYKVVRARTVTEYDRRLIRAIHSRIEVVQSLALGTELRALDERIEEYGEANRAQTGAQILIFQGIRVLTYGVIAFTYWKLGHEYLNGAVGLPEIILLITFIGVFTSTIYDLSETYVSFTDSIVHIEQLWQKLDEAPVTPNLSEGPAYVHKKGKIEFSDVSFAYRENLDVVSGFSYVFEAWKRYALVGESGGGKSTVMKLASGFLFPTSGSVKIDAFDTKTVNLSTLYPYVGYLSQDPSVFDGTIRDNLAYGSQSEATEEQIRTALEKAEASFVFQFPEGLDTEIGERGVKLSGGQKQRLAIAKTFLKNPSVLFLDEPTSALDSLSEEAITKSFEGLFENKTVLIIAHRLKTVQQADVILVIENGAVAESGTHAELLEKNGKYARMLAAQTHF